MTLNLAEMSVAKSRPSVPYAANLFLVGVSTHFPLMLWQKGIWPIRIRGQRQRGWSS